LEPTARWDWVKHGLALGASLGPAFMLHHAQRTVTEVTDFTVGPMVAVRVGWSQPFSLIGRRLHVIVEPKMRLIDGEFNPTISLQIGAGRGY